MSYAQPLFQEDSKGKPRVWSVTTNGDKVIVSHGLVGGKIVVKTTVAKPKNIGKANETTGAGQAILEAQSKWQAQVDRKDYHTDISMAGKQMRPQLALSYHDVADQVKWGVESYHVMPKLDGFRMAYGQRYLGVGECEYMSREGITYKVDHMHTPCTNMLAIVQQELIKRYSTDIVCKGLDGEGYLHGLRQSDIRKYCVKYYEGLTEAIQFHLFDLYIDGLTQQERYAVLKAAYITYKTEHPSCNVIQVVESYPVDSFVRMKDAHDHYVKLGYEGVILRLDSAMYTAGKHANVMWKYKEFFDDEFKIIEVWEDKNGCAMFTLELPQGMLLATGDAIPADTTCKCTPKATHEERIEMLNNVDDYLNKWWTVRYFSLTVHGKLEFPVGHGERKCDSKGKPLE